LTRVSTKIPIPGNALYKLATQKYAPITWMSPKMPRLFASLTVETAHAGNLIYLLSGKRVHRQHHPLPQHNKMMSEQSSQRLPTAPATTHPSNNHLSKRHQ